MAKAEGGSLFRWVLVKGAIGVYDPTVARIVVSVAYAMATAGLLILGNARHLLFDQAALIVLAAVALLGLAVILVTRQALPWLFVGGVWIYACVMAIWRANSSYSEEAGLGLIFGAIALGALAAYIAGERKYL
jgi:hypothetical protein